LGKKVKASKKNITKKIQFVD